MAAAVTQTMSSASKFLLSNNKDEALTYEKDIEKRIMSLVYMKQVRIKEFFEDFDPLRKGTVTEDKFRTGLSKLQMHLKEEEIMELIKRYMNAEGLVRYKDFCQNINQQFFNYDMAKDNLYKTKSQAIYSEDENRIVERALQHIRQEIKTRRILLKQSFQDFDRTRSSHVTTHQFGRVLTKLGMSLEGHVIELVARKYVDNANAAEINYLQFCADVDDVKEMIDRVAHSEPKNEHTYVSEDVITDTASLNLMTTLYVSKRLPPASQNLQLERKIQAQVIMKQIRINEFFRDVDTLRKGHCSEGQFLRIINMSGIQISEEEMKLLTDKYKSSTTVGMVNYKEFCENIDRIFTEKELEKKPLLRVPGVNPEITLPIRRQYLGISAQEKAELDELLVLYRSIISCRRMLMKPQFHDLDRTKTGHVSKNQFLRVLNQFQLFPTDEKLNLLLKRYLDKGNLDEVNYYDFCRDVDIHDDGTQKINEDHANQFKLPQSQHLGDSAAYILNHKPNDLEDLLAKLRRKVKEQRIRIGEFLRDFDKLRSGGITNAQFRLGLNMAKLPLSNSEFDMLLDRFKLEGKDGYVKWRDFVDVIDEVFTVKQLEKSPGFEVTEPNLRTRYGRNEMSELEREIGEVAKRRFKEYCKGTRLDVKQFFQDWDRNGRNRVTPKQFRQVLTTVKFTLSDDEFNALVKMYATDDEQDMKYVDFINDTNPMIGLEQFWAQNSSKEQFGMSSSFTKTEKAKLTFHTLLDRIKNDVKMNRLRCGEYFQDFDSLRKGLIPKIKFRGVLSKMNLNVTEEEIIQLENHYVSTVDPSKIDYKNFLADIEVVFTLPNLDKDPLTKPVEWTSKTYIDPNNILNPEEEQRLDALLNKMAFAVITHRLLLKPFFQDKDKARCGKVSFTRFRSILDVLKLSLGESDYKLLCKRFGYMSTEFNYIEFDEVLRSYVEKPQQY